MSQLHNVTLALELLKDEGLLDYPINPEGERVVHVGAAVSGDSLCRGVLLLGMGTSHDGGAVPTASAHPTGGGGLGRGHRGLGTLGQAVQTDETLRNYVWGGTARGVQGRTGWVEAGARPCDGSGDSGLGRPVVLFDAGFSRDIPCPKKPLGSRRSGTVVTPLLALAED